MISKINSKIVICILMAYPYFITYNFSRQNNSNTDGYGDSYKIADLKILPPMNFITVLYFYDCNMTMHHTIIITCIVAYISGDSYACILSSLLTCTFSLMQTISTWQITEHNYIYQIFVRTIKSCGCYRSIYNLRL